MSQEDVVAAKGAALQAVCESRVPNEHVPVPGTGTWPARTGER